MVISFYVILRTMGPILVCGLIFPVGIQTGKVWIPNMNVTTF